MLFAMTDFAEPFREILTSLSSGYGILCYILGSIGLYTLSQRRGYRFSWQAWVPFVRDYALGNMADNINYCRGKPTRLRFWMLATVILNAGIFLFFIAAVFAGSLLGAWFRPDWDFLEWMGWMFFLFLAMLALFAVVWVFRVVVECIVYFRIFSDYSAGNAVGFLLLHIFFGAGPILLFALRGKIPITLYPVLSPQVHPPGPYGRR